MNKNLLILISFIFFTSALLLSKNIENNNQVSNLDYVFFLDTMKSYNWFNNINCDGYPIYYKYYYNPQELVSLIISFSFDSVSNNTKYKNRDILFYNTDNLIVEDVYQENISIDSCTLWFNKKRTIYNYDNKLNLSEKITQIYEENEDLKNWKNVDKNTYSYDLFGNLIVVEFSNYDDNFNKWNNKFRNIFIYYFDANITEKWSEIWNYDQNTWKKTYRNIFVYNELNDIVFTYYSLPNSDSTDWILPIIPLYTYGYWYNELKNKTIAFTLCFNNISNKYLPYDSTIYIYDNKNNLIEKKILLYDSLIETKWMKYKQYFYKYDMYNNLIEDSVYTAGILNSLKNEYVYLETTSVIENIFKLESERLLVFPNPAQDYINIIMNLTKAGNIKLYVYDLSLQNKILIHNNYYDTGTHNFIYNTRDLPSGTYFIELTTDDIFTVKQLLIVK